MNDQNVRKKIIIGLLSAIAIVGVITALVFIQQDATGTNVFTALTVRTTTSARATTTARSTTVARTTTTVVRSTPVAPSSSAVATSAAPASSAQPAPSANNNNGGSAPAAQANNSNQASGGNCSYGSTQARVHPNITIPWTQTLTIACGQSFEIGGFHDGTGQFATDVTLKVTGPNGFTFTGGNGAKVTTPNVAGIYTLTVTTNGCGNSANLTDTATVTCTSTSPNPRSTTTTTTNTLLAGCGNMDVNSDGKFTLTDLSNFATKYKTNCDPVGNATFNSCGPLDSDKNGKVDLADLSHFGKLYKADSCAS
jgi:hypothetical protein